MVSPKEHGQILLIVVLADGENVLNLRKARLGM